ncbi:MBL fold metallo-hydrolase [Ralstonia solanacearum]|uniref:FprA family A-type flavoprotein n=1 Tax=Ralstonia solanacearum TaxID=305 RepID=A0AAE3NLZ7_RALSL|nr:MBL fold metallo-hydrolase [Ralstonia solanacearum]KFX27159.1 beta-lactamase [Ralstonia solanacearum]MBB6581569.1 FprA family A-type flavoprotein [Ralstonia solanacearum]MDB0524695.1 FprA family A-type flavoprotein [Ralstonia solanacearum]QHB55323.1 MBL fold metallo-hydrolase [Ralstonia solanacearum]
MVTTLYETPEHACLMFSDLVDDHDDQSVQTNQFLVVDHGHGALIDPGGNMTYNALYLAMNHYFPPKQLDYVLASHADPDIVASAGRWLTSSSCDILISRVWERFLPHFCSVGKTEGRIVPIPDTGMAIPIGQSHLLAVPAHFLHSEGNFQFYDPVSRILFSGDLGASMVHAEIAAAPVEDFDAHIPLMAPFHRRYMSGNRVCRLWAEMVRGLEIEWIVPQHGRAFRGPAMVRRFIDWVETLACGIDLMTAETFRLPALPRTAAGAALRTPQP